uniref:peptidylprolyl isomerase n=1 Tax=Phlebotomus kandelakii TaxID=1109342 RepID=A0A6B2E5I1_9DIPT
MVFGLVLTPNKKYSQTVEKDYQLSNAALDTDTCGPEKSKLMVTVDKNTLLLCTLSKENPQYSLDLQLSKGQKVAFCSIGSGTIHLVGYMLPDMEDGLDDDEQSDASEEENEQAEVPQLVPIEGKKNKKSPAAAVGEDSDEEEESDDEDFDLLEADEDSDEDEGDEEEEEEGDSDDSDEDEEKQEPQKKKLKGEAKLNGLENGEAQKKTKEGKKTKKELKQEGQKKENQQKGQDKGGKKKVIQGGVIIEDLKVGDGPEVKASKKAVVYYEGRLKSNNKVFDSCKNGKGFKFTVGRGEVIRGWDVGVAGMKVGSKRRIICPPAMAYGSKGSPPVIPPNSTLVFEVELRNVKN